MIPVWIDNTQGRSISYLAAAPFDFATHLQLVAINDLDGIHQRGEGIVEQRGQHSTDLRAAVLGLHPGEDEVKFLFLRVAFENGRNAPGVGAVKSLVEKKHALLGTHGHLTAQNLLVFVAANRGDGHLAAGSGDNLQGLFDRIVVWLIDRIDQVIALNVIASPVEPDLVLRGIGHSSGAN